MSKNMPAARIYDTTLSIHFDDPNDPACRKACFNPLKRLLRRRGWTVVIDAKTAKDYPSLRFDHFLCQKGPLRADLRITGRVIEFETWTETWPTTHHSGHRYEFDKLRKMPFLDRLRHQNEQNHLIKWLRAHFPIEVTNANLNARPEFGVLTAQDYIKLEWQKSWHLDKTLGHPNWNYASNRTSADGHLLENGQTVWFFDSKGRLSRGKTYYSLNNRWYVAASAWSVTCYSCSEIFIDPPADIRTKRNQRIRRSRLEKELAKAINAMNFERAAVIRDICFGTKELFLIYKPKHGAYYGTNYCGYVCDHRDAGRYTLAEAEAEFHRVPTEVTIRHLNGEPYESAPERHAA